MTTITVTEAARGFSDLINRIRYRGEAVTLLKGGKPVAMLSPVPKSLTGRELAEIWPTMHHLSKAEAASFAKDIATARKHLPKPRSKWD